MYIIIYIYTHIHVLIHMYIYIHNIYRYAWPSRALTVDPRIQGLEDSRTQGFFVVIVGWTCWFPAFQNVQQKYWNSLNLFSDFLWMLVRAYCVSNDPIVMAYCFQSHCSSSPLCFELFVDEICLNPHVYLSSPHMLVGWGCFLPRLSRKNTFFRPFLDGPCIYHSWSLYMRLFVLLSFTLWCSPQLRGQGGQFSA